MDLPATNIHNHIEYAELVDLYPSRPCPGFKLKLCLRCVFRNDAGGSVVRERLARARRGGADRGRGWEEKDDTD